MKYELRTYGAFTFYATTALGVAATIFAFVLLINAVQYGFELGYMGVILLVFLVIMPILLYTYSKQYFQGKTPSELLTSENYLLITYKNGSEEKILYSEIIKANMQFPHRGRDFGGVVVGLVLADPKKARGIWVKDKVTAQKIIDEINSKLA